MTDVHENCDCHVCELRDRFLEFMACVYDNCEDKDIIKYCEDFEEENAELLGIDRADLWKYPGSRACRNARESDAEDQNEP